MTSKTLVHSHHFSLRCTMATLKEQKEAFVTGHDGTHPAEIVLICASGVVGYWLFSVMPMPTIQETKNTDIAWMSQVGCVTCGSAGR